MNIRFANYFLCDAILSFLFLGRIFCCLRTDIFRKCCEKWGSCHGM